MNMKDRVFQATKIQTNKFLNLENLPQISPIFISGALRPSFWYKRPGPSATIYYLNLFYSSCSRCGPVDMTGLESCHEVFILFYCALVLMG